jgi:tRNA modification GTPase
MTPTATIAAIATPSGRGGVGVIRLSGNDLAPFIRDICGKNPATLTPRRAVFTTFSDAVGAPIDEGIALYFAAPHSYTGENVLELQGHGGVAVMRALLSRCLELGARLAEPGEFTRRAFMNDKLDLAQAEAVADLIDAATATAARAATRSLSGAFSREINTLAEEMIDVRVHIEASLDFPEEEIDEVVDDATLAQVLRLRDHVAALYDRAQSGAKLREGLTVVLVGSPNVGKSSLLNRLAREDAAIVTPYAGTTRDTIERQISLAGYPLTIIDTAGLRDTQDAVEKIGIERTWAAIERADIAIVLHDCQDTHDTPETQAILARLPSNLPRILVQNKSDLIGDDARAALKNDRDLILISAKTGDGIRELEDAVLNAVHAQPATEDTFLARERHLRAINDALRELNHAVEQIQSPAPAFELVAEQLRRAHDALGAITGKVAPDDLLGEIFSRFCIGK